MGWVALLIMVILLGSTLNGAPIDTPKDCTPPATSVAQVEYIGGHRVIQRLNEEDVCLEIDGEAVWVTLMPTTEELANNIVNCGDYDNFMKYVRSQGGDDEYAKKLFESGDKDALLQYCIQIGYTVG